VRDDLADVELANILFAPHYAAAFPMTCASDATPVCQKAGGEQVSELLRGERFMALDISAGWTWGFCAHDHYVGYARSDDLSTDARSVPGQHAGELVEAASTFIGVPYVFGGRGGTGIDCSGLVQRACADIGISAPRDCDMQHESLGTLLDDSDALRRNDLVFFPGHVGIMVDSENMIHATSTCGAVVIEPLATVLGRTVTIDDVPIVARKRL